ncbi:DDE-type integrase/transposase/recombinase [Scytonema sp. UIC 10036]|uniref:DDE-type integrase/transposase/recombinase n=1 Tax=Scytonema sp. UIC 10036 TaxID=2304196 RepID=UPI0012DA8DFA|nr:DDE-type integrase/transposase/recombinase [Scytonema sp. UIC 10036]MUG91690.1 DDE-type integrase/transposase/recombinase [Scytonema sp. UIC 10036]
MLSVNQIICWHNDNKLDRVIYIDWLNCYIVTIDINNSKAQPIIHRYQEIESAIDGEQASLLNSDPYAKYLMTDSELSTIQCQYRDNAWKAVSLIINYGSSIFEPHERSRVIKEVSELCGRSEPTIRKDLRRYWQGGQIKNALIPRFDSRRGQELSNPISSYLPQILNSLYKYAFSILISLKENIFWSNENFQEFALAYKILTISHHPKRGRPSSLSYAVGKKLGINITIEIREKFRKGIKLFYENRQKMPLTKAYQKTLEKFFNKGYKLSDGILVPNLPLAEELPSFDQFKYWYEKDYDINKKLIAREGQIKYNLVHRAVLGNSTQMAFGPGALFQIDCTIADLYLVSKINRNWIIGRPTLYLVIDVFSRLIVGFAVTLEPPSWLGAMLALENTITDKVEFCKNWGIEITEYEWPSHHLPAEIIADRGEFKSYKANNLSDSLGIEINNTPPYRADFKGIIERSFRYFNDEIIHWLPGSVKHLPSRGERDYRLDGVLTTDAFRKLMILFILDHNNENLLI